MRRAWPYVVVVAGTLAMHAGSIFTRYAWSDDYPSLLAAQRPGISPSDAIIGGARPLYAVLLDGSFGLAGSIDGLRVVRLLGVLGVAAFACVVVRAVRRAGATPLASGLFALAVVALPAFQTFGAWANVWPYGWACALSAAGSLALLDRPGTRSTLLALGAVTVAFLVYQPAAMCVLVPLAAELAVRRPATSVAARVATAHAIVTAAGAATGYTIGRIVIALTDTTIVARATLVRPGDVPDKVWWFVSRPIVISLRPFDVSSPSTIAGFAWAAAAGAVVVVGFLLATRRVPLLLLAAAVLPAAGLPHLLLAENQIDFRILAAMSPIGLLYVAVGAEQIARRLVRRTGAPTALLGIVATIGVVGAALLGVRHTRQLFIDPSVEQERYLRGRLDAYDAASERPIDVVVPASGWPTRRRVGIYSTISDIPHGWVARQHVLLLLRERGSDLPADEVRVVTEATDEDDVFVVDTSPLKHLG